MYTLGIVDGTTTSHRIIGSVRRALHAPSEADAVREALASADTTIVSVTVTEKGYCMNPVTRRLDRAHPDVRHDVDHPDIPAASSATSCSRPATGGTPGRAISPC